MDGTMEGVIVGYGLSVSYGTDVGCGAMIGYGLKIDYGMALQLCSMDGYDNVWYCYMLRYDNVWYYYTHDRLDCSSTLSLYKNNRIKVKKKLALPKKIRQYCFRAQG